MKGRQINFFAMPDEWEPLEKYLEENNMICVPTTSDKEELKPIKITEGDLFKYFIRKEDISLVKFYYIEETKLYYIDESHSPVIKFFRSYYNKKDNLLRRSRFYFTKGYWDENQKWQQKPQQFIDNAEKLFKWFRKVYKPLKHPDYRLIYLTKDVKEECDSNNLVLEVN